MNLKILLLLSIYLLASAACANNSPTPVKDNNDLVYAAQKKYVAGISWEEAKLALEQENIKVKAMNIFEPRQNADFYVALVITETGTREAYELRPYSSDGKEFFWKASNLPIKLYEESLFPNTSYKPTSEKDK